MLGVASTALDHSRAAAYYRWNITHPGGAHVRNPSRLGISRQALYNILEAKNGVSPIMALKLARLCGTAPEFLLDCQGRYDLAVAAQRYAAEIEAVLPFQIGAP